MSVHGKFTGVVTATSFVGSGTALTGIDATLKFGNATKAEQTIVVL